MSQAGLVGSGAPNSSNLYLRIHSAGAIPKYSKFLAQFQLQYMCFQPRLSHLFIFEMCANVELNMIPWELLLIWHQAPLEYKDLLLVSLPRNFKEFLVI